MSWAACTATSLAEGVPGHRVTLGNVEYAISTPDADFGCGCDYPDYISDTVVLNSTPSSSDSATLPAPSRPIWTALARLPRHLTIEVAGQRVGIVHGGLALPFDWRNSFLDQWPPGSPAHAGYYDRILHGTHLIVAQAACGTIALAAPSLAMSTGKPHW